MVSKFEWTGLGSLLLIAIAAVALAGWQAAVDRTVFEPYFGSMRPTVAMVGAALVGIVAMASLQGTSTFAMSGPGDPRDAVSIVAWTVPLLAAVAIGADLVLRFPEDINVALPDALRFYPAIAVFVELVLHLVPISVLVAVFGMPSALDATFWRIAIPVALVEATLQALYANSLSTSVFSAVHLTVFGVIQVWVFWRFGFVWMLGVRLAYYALWHLAWGAARLELLF